MTAWGNRYSALFQEPATVKSTPTLPSSSPVAPSANQVFDSSPIYSKPLPRVRFPSNSSVFVAGLPHNITAQEIRQRLCEVISQVIDFIHVKIVDGQGNRVAFVQARSTEDAHLLLNTELFLEGNTLRLELAHAHRALWVSYTNINLPHPTIRIIRNSDQFLRPLFNETPPEHEWTPRVPDDPFSGTGYVINQIEYTEGALRKLCELLGPLEEFKQVNLPGQVDPSRYEPHILYLPSSNTQTRIWEIKWQAREDATRARALLETLPFINWSWAHTMKKLDDQYRNESPMYRPNPAEYPPGKARLTGNNPHFQHAHTIKRVHGPVISKGEDSDVSAHKSLRLDIDEFPPLIAGQRTLSSRRYLAKHERTVSEDSVAPITPVSLHHPSPEIANLSGEDNGADPTISTPTFEKLSPVVQPSHRPDTVPFREHGGYTHSYDRSTLYVSGIPHIVGEAQLKQLMIPYGRFKSLNIIPNPRGEFSTAFISYADVETAAKVLEATSDIPPMVNFMRLRIRYKRINPPKFAQRRRFANHAGGSQQENNRTPKRVARKAVEEAQEPVTSEIVQNDGQVKLRDMKDSQKQGDNDEASSVEDQPSLPLVNASEIGDLAKSHDAGNDSIKSMETSPSPSGPNLKQEQTPDEPHNNKPPEDIATPVQERTAPATNPSLPKAGYYGYYGPPIPLNYHGHWGYPYPMYPPVYPYQPYSHAYWYPPPPTGVSLPGTGAYVHPHTTGKKVENVRMEHMSSFPHGTSGEHPTYASAKPPVAPATSYQTPDGGVTYVYPTEVIEKYMSGTPKAQEKENSHSYHGSDIQSNQFHPSISGQYPYGVPYPSFSTPSPLRLRHPQGTPEPKSACDVNPFVAAAVYRDYPLPPPPADKMPQGSFIFNPQGVVQYVEPTSYASSTQLGGPAGGTPGHGIGVVQAAAAVVASEYHQMPCPTPLGFSNSPPEARFDVQSASSRYGSPPFYGQHHHPQVMYHPNFPQAGSAMASPEHSTGGKQGNRGGNRRRGSHMMQGPAYAMGQAGTNASTGSVVNSHGSHA